jgi:hypothetical protein
MNASEINPFADQIINEPQRLEAVVAGLNDQPLEILLADFARLADGQAPRAKRRIPYAHLVVSPQPGYGKSHLIGRLYREIQGRAIFVYVLAIQNPATVFQSLMQAIVRELHFPPRSSAGPLDRQESTQLDLLAHHLFAHALADLIENQMGIEIDTPPETAAELRADPLLAFNRGTEGDLWADWMRQNFEKLLPFFEEALESRGVVLHAPRAWLRALFHYAWSPFDAIKRRYVRDWITAQPLEPEEYSRLGMRAADAPEGEISPHAANELCRQRLADLGQLAGYFRPLVFCFDQTEIYAHQTPLARSFGMAVAALVNEVQNHLTVVTSNQEPWVARIEPNMEDADVDRLAKPFLTLEGLTRDQGQELVRLRLEAWQKPPVAVASFLDKAWLAELFPTATNQMGARHFLQKCKERWARQPAPSAPLSELYQQHRDRLLAEPKRHLFEPDILQWLVEEAARGLPDLKVTRVEHTYFRVKWQTPERICLFGFEAGAHWKRWETVVKISQNAASATPPAKSVFFRTPEQAALPGAWKIADQFRLAQASCLHIIVLGVEEIAELYAAKELFADAAQQNIPFSAAQVMSFLREQLAPWWERLCGPVDASPAPLPEPPPGAGAPLSVEVREIVWRERFLSIDEVILKLSTPASKDDVLKACGHSVEIRIHSHPNMIVLQWQNS